MVARRGGIEGQAPVGVFAGRNLQFQFAGQRCHGGSLYHKRHKHDEESSMEHQLGIRQAGDDREQGQDNRYRAPQTHPADKAQFPAVEAEGPERQQNRQRANHEDQCKGQNQAAPSQGYQVRRVHQQPQHQEQTQLGQPGQAIVYLQDHGHHAHVAITDHHTTQIDGEKTATANGVGGRKHGDAGCGH